MPSHRVRRVNGHFYVYFRDIGRKPVEKSYPLGTSIKQKRSAETYARRLFNDFLEGRFDPWTVRRGTVTPPTVLETLDLYLSAHPHLRPKSVEGYTTAANGLDRLLPVGLTLPYVEASHVRPYVEAPGVSEATRQTRFRSLRSVFNWAKTEGLIRESPLSSLRLPKVGRREADFLSKNDFKRLMAFLDGEQAKGRKTEWLRNAVVLAVATGLRRGELCALRWGAVDLAQGFLTVRNEADFKTKSGHERRVALVPDAVALLMRLESERFGNDPVDRAAFVVQGATGGPAYDHYLSRRFKEVVRTAGLPEAIHWHSLRHTSASWLVMSGAHLQVVSQVLGHSSVQVTQRYAHLSPDAMSRDMQRAFGAGSLVPGGTEVQRRGKMAVRRNRVGFKKRLQSLEKAA